MTKDRYHLIYVSFKLAVAILLAHCVLVFIYLSIAYFIGRNPMPWMVPYTFALIVIISPYWLWLLIHKGFPYPRLKVMHILFHVVGILTPLISAGAMLPSARCVRDVLGLPLASMYAETLSDKIGWGYMYFMDFVWMSSFAVALLPFFIAWVMIAKVKMSLGEHLT